MMPDPQPDTRCRNTEIARMDAEQGSDQLAKAMRKEFLQLAVRHGITVGDAKLLLMNGVSV